MPLQRETRILSWPKISSNSNVFNRRRAASFVKKDYRFIGFNTTSITGLLDELGWLSLFERRKHSRLTVFSQPSIYIDGWLYAMSMTSVVCNVPVLSQKSKRFHISSFCLHDMKVTSLRYLDAKFHHPSLGASPPNRGKTVRALVKWRTVTP